MNKSRRTGCKFLEAADRKTVGPTAAGVARGNSGVEGAQKVTTTIGILSRRPKVTGTTNAGKITGTVVPAPGSRKTQPLD